MQKRSGWIDDYEIEPGQAERAQRIAWILIANAIDCSMLADCPDKPIKTGTDAIRSMAESRRWLMDESNAVPGEYLGDGLVAGATLSSCLNVLQISRMSFKRILRHLWLRQDDIIKGTLREQLKSSKRAIRAEKRDNASHTGKGGPKSAARSRGRVLVDAAKVMKESGDWIGA